MQQGPGVVVPRRKPRGVSCTCSEAPGQDTDLTKEGVADALHGSEPWPAQVAKGSGEEGGRAPEEEESRGARGHVWCRAAPSPSPQATWRDFKEASRRTSWLPA